MCGRQSLLPPLVFFLPLLCNLFFSTAAVAVLKPGEQLRENETLLSAGGSFQLGFFPAGGGSRRYLGIWYGNIPERTIVWVANRKSPIITFPGALSVSTEGKLSLSGGDGAVIWSSSSDSPGAVAELLETGNLVLKAEAEKDEEKFFWQSFDYPTDTLLPGMKLGWNLKTRLDRHLLSWKGPDDPSPGDFSFRMDIHGSPQMFLMNQTAKLYRSGPWNGVRLSGVPEMKSNDVFTFRFVANSEEVYYTYEPVKKELVSRLVVTTYGELHRFVLLEKRWNNYWHAPKDQCDRYSFCGPYGVCDSNRSPVCSCLAGFKPKSPTDWALRDGTDGCEREIPLECGTGEGFVPMSGMKLPDVWQAVMYKNMSIEECAQACLRSCSCAAYTAADIRDGSGCIMWAGELTDLRHYLEDGQDVYMRTPASLLGGATGGGWSRKKRVAVSVSVGVVGGLLILLGCGVFILLRRRPNDHCGEDLKQRRNSGFGGGDREDMSQRRNSGGGREDMSQRRNSGVGREDMSQRRGSGGGRGGGGGGGDDDLELPLILFDQVAAATDEFSEDNKLGEGGFGPVYKGQLPDGQEIAVKRLSKTSVQGLTEFQNEVQLIAKLQHRNLVRLLGCCVDGDERILIYEYMHNKSLDSIIFDNEKSALLNWPTRFNIIVGVSRGLLYLHQDSRFRIIHRDLKASNILLDREMNPKISDFGAARAFRSDRDGGAEKTCKVVGTYGYMSPEYAMHGAFSIKSDVFSFGVLVLEIISGKRNKGFYYDDSFMNITQLAWKLWTEGDCSPLVDEAMANSYSPPELTKCVQVALLCVQERAEDRPNMATVVTMLGSAGPALPPPKQPGVAATERSPVNSPSVYTRVEESLTVNQLTVTILRGR